MRDGGNSAGASHSFETSAWNRGLAAPGDLLQSLLPALAGRDAALGSRSRKTSSQPFLESQSRRSTHLSLFQLEWHRLFRPISRAIHAYRKSPA